MLFFVSKPKKIFNLIVAILILMLTLLAASIRRSSASQRKYLIYSNSSKMINMLTLLATSIRSSVCICLLNKEGSVALLYVSKYNIKSKLDCLQYFQALTWICNVVAVAILFWHFLSCL